MSLIKQASSYKTGSNEAPPLAVRFLTVIINAITVTLLSFLSVFHHYAKCRHSNTAIPFTDQHKGS